jgi:hypothetical protein
MWGRWWWYDGELRPTVTLETKNVLEWLNNFVVDARIASGEISIKWGLNDLDVIRIFDDFYSKRVIESRELMVLKNEEVYHGHKKSGSPATRLSIC